MRQRFRSVACPRILGAPTHLKDALKRARRQRISRLSPPQRVPKVQLVALREPRRQHRRKLLPTGEDIERIRPVPAPLALVPSLYRNCEPFCREWLTLLRRHPRIPRWLQRAKSRFQMPLRSNLLAL